MIKTKEWNDVSINLFIYWFAFQTLKNISFNKLDEQFLLCTIFNIYLRIEESIKEFRDKYRNCNPETKD